MKVRWWPFSNDHRIASTRIRCLSVVAGLRARGIDAALWGPNEPTPDILVLSKRYDPATLDVARRLQAAGTRVLLDLCDNLFYAESEGTPSRQREAWLRHALAQVDGVTVSTGTLADVIRTEAPAQTALRVVGDAFEPPLEPSGPWNRGRLAAEARLLRLRAQVALRRSAVRLLWFGHHGSSHASGGMLDLLSVMAPLNDVAAATEVALTVISNSLEKFRRIQAAARFPCQYLEWDVATFSRAARLHQVSLLPVRLNPFTACKTNNRVATSLVHGLAVIADPVPSYAEFKDMICLADWHRSLQTLCTAPGTREEMVKRGCKHLLLHWSQDGVIDQWISSLESLTGQPLGPKMQKTQ